VVVQVPTDRREVHGCVDPDLGQLVRGTDPGEHQQPRRIDIDRVSSQLLPRVALLTRLLTSRLGCELSRTELGLLNTLSSGPRRITDLAELERLAQPTLTQLVQRLEQQGFVSRERQTDDGRVVLVSLTEAGAVALDDFRSRASAALGAHLLEQPDAEVESLAAATDTLGRLVALLQQGPMS
jgi:DNA-binding MarR family transcriptional regulator